MYIKLEPDNPVAKLIENKHQEYRNKAIWHFYTYYALRIIAGLCAVMLLLELMEANPRHGYLKWLSGAIAIVSVIELIFAPRDRYALYSKATDLLTIAKIKALPDDVYSKYQETLNLLLETESADLQRLISLNDLVSQIDQAHWKKVGIDLEKKE